MFPTHPEAGAGPRTLKRGEEGSPYGSRWPGQDPKYLPLLHGGQPAKLSGTQYPKMELAGTKYPKMKLAGTQYLKMESAGTKYPNMELAGTKYPKMELAGTKYSKMELASTQYPNMELAVPSIPRWNWLVLRTWYQPILQGGFFNFPPLNLAKSQA